MASISRKFGQLKQWTGEKFGSSDKTSTSDDYKQLEMETETRKDGIENLQAAMAAYVKTIDKRSVASKTMLPVVALAKAMIQQARFHGEDSVFGLALLKIGEGQDCIGKYQDEYVSKLRQGFVFELEALMSSMKDYQALKKKLGSRRLDYDAKQNKLQHSKKEKPELEEATRTAQFKYEETLHDITSLMASFAQREEMLLQSLVEFARVQHDYFKRGMEITEAMVGQLDNERIQAQMRENSEAQPTTMSSSRTKLATSSASRAESKESLAEVTPQPIANMSRSNSTTGPSYEEATKTTSLARLAPRPLPASPQPTVLKRARALYAFTGENSTELSIQKGDVIEVTRFVDEGWWIGECNGCSGMFPANYVEIIEAVAEPAPAYTPPIQPKPTTTEPEPELEARVAEGIQNISLPPSDNSQAAQQAMQAPGFSYLPRMPPGTDLAHLVKARAPPKQAAPEPAPEAAIIPTCNECGCDDFTANVFKPGSCNNCFHKH